MSVFRISRTRGNAHILPRRARGFALPFVLVLFIMLSGITYMSAQNTGRTIKTAVMSRDFIQAGQMADYAVQDALYRLNEPDGTALPFAGAPRTGATASGDWQWYADTITAAVQHRNPLTGVLGDDLNAGRITTIHAKGTFRGVNREVTATARSLKVGGFKVGTDQQLIYEAGPAAAFSHTILGRTVQVQNGTGVGAATPFLTGPIGVNGPGPLDLKNYPGLDSPAKSTYLLYGGQAANLNVPEAVKLSAAIGLDASFVTENASRCGGAAPAAWVASRSGGVLVADNNVACYASMLFDVPTTIVGAGAFNAFVTGNIVFNEPAKAAASGTGLNIYTNGSVTFNTTAVTGAPMELKNTFIYAPKGACKTSPFRDLTKGLTFTGSLACDTVAVAGQFADAPAVNPLGNDATKDKALYNREIWFTAGYKQPSGTRN